AGRVDRAVSGGDRGQPRLALANRHLIAPVEPLLVSRLATLGSLYEAHLSAGITDARVGEGPHELPARVALPERVCVREGDHLAPSALHCRVLRPDLAATWKLQHDVGARLTRALGGRVLAAVARDDHLEQLAGIVERKRVLDLRPDHVLLVVRRDDQAQR